MSFHPKNGTDYLTTRLPFALFSAKIVFFLPNT